MKNGYNTKQKASIVSFLKKDGKAVSATGIVKALKENGVKIGTATVYRRLEDLVEEGVCKKYITDKGAFFSYINSEKGTFQLKCTKCNRVFSVSCDMLSSLAPHILSHHDFALDETRTVMYGRCKNCMEEKKDE